MSDQLRQAPGLTRSQHPLGQNTGAWKLNFPLHKELQSQDIREGVEERDRKIEVNT